MFIFSYNILFEMKIKKLCYLILSCAIIFFSEYVIALMILIVSLIMLLIVIILITLTSFKGFFSYIKGISFFFFFSGCTGSELRLAGSLVAACKLLVAVCKWDLVP